MRCHDHDLCGYEVRDFGGTIVLHLQLRSSDGTVVQSTIRFDDVVFYHFVHTSPAIILDIEEIPLARFMSCQQVALAKWHTQLGVLYWSSGPEDYLAKLQQEGIKAWVIGSNIGFTGCVAAKLAYQVE